MPNALVTGTSSGFGLATVERLAHLGWSVIAAQRDPSTARDDAPYDTLAIDLRDGASIARMGTVVDALDGGLDALVSNAGFGILGPLEEVSDAEFRDQLEVNRWSRGHFAHRSSPRARQSDAIVAAAIVPGAPFRLPVGSGIGPMIREKVARVLADLDAAEAFLASSRDSVCGDGTAPDLR